MALVDSVLPLVDSDERTDRGGYGQEGDGGDASDGESFGALLLVDVVAFEVVFCEAVDGRGDVGDCGAEASVAQVELGVVAGPAQVEPAWFLVERVDEGLGKAVGADAAIGLEGEGAVGDDDEDVVERLAFQPSGDFAVDPFGAG